MGRVEATKGPASTGDTRGVTVLARTFDEASSRFGSRPALVWPGGAISYQDLAVVIDEAAGGLAALGVGPGQLVALALPSGPAYVAAYLAASHLGATVTGFNPRYVADERRKVAAQAQPDLAAGRSGQKLAQGHQFRIGRFGEPAPAHHELVAEIAQMRHWPAEGRQTQAQKDGEHGPGAVLAW